MLRNNEDFVLMSSLLDLSWIVPAYTMDLHGDLQAQLPSMGSKDICILTGEMAPLEIMQAIFDHAVEKADPACSVVLPNLDYPIDASRGAVALDLAGIDIEETFLYRLDLLVGGEDDKDDFLVLLQDMERGQHHAPYDTEVYLLPTSMGQIGLLLAIFGMDNFNPQTCERELLFEVGIQPDVDGSLYTLVNSVDSDYNLDFTLLCRNHVLDESGVLARIHCSNSGVIDLRDGNFTRFTNWRKEDWLLKRYTFEEWAEDKRRQHDC
jgi:hypothetical protein